MSSLESQNHIAAGSLRERLEETLSRSISNLLEAGIFSRPEETIDSCISSIRSADDLRCRYRHVPEPVGEAYLKLSASDNSSASADFNACMAVRMMLSANESETGIRLSEETRNRTRKEFDRILSAIEHGNAGYLTLEKDHGAKDLGICRLRLLHFGAELADTRAGVPRRVLAAGTLRQSLDAVRFFAVRSRTFKMFLEVHWDMHLIREFTPTGVDECYRRVARVLSLNPQINGVFGSSWWFDPVMEEISPELYFLQELYRENGAISIDLGMDDESVRDATTFSPKRTKLYKDGSYVPNRVMLIWHRDDVLRWSGLT